MKDPFLNFKKYAFRLELLQEYDVPEEKESFGRFLRTGEVKDDNRDEWASIIQSAISRGATMNRVHVIKEPLSDYIRFELTAYKFNIKEGEKVFLLSQKEFDELKMSINSDFWLFDDELVLEMNYDKKGKFIESRELRKDIKSFIKLKAKLLQLARPL